MYQVDSRNGMRHAIEAAMPEQSPAGGKLPRARCKKPIRPVKIYPADEPLPGPRRYCKTCFGTRRSPEWRLAALNEQVAALIETAKDEDPWMLGGLLRIKDRITEGSAEIVFSLRQHGIPWDAIGAEITSRTGRPLGKDGAYNRFAKRIGELDPGRSGPGDDTDPD